MIMTTDNTNIAANGGKSCPAGGAHEIEHRVWADMKRWLSPALRFVVPIGCSVALVWWLFSKANFHDMVQVLHHNVQYGYLLLLMFFNGMSYVFRARRWGLQLDGVGVHVPFTTLCVSIFGAYALNLLMSGVGEAWRCIFISRRSGVSLSRVVGTDVGDRSSDGVCVIFLLLLTLLVAHKDIDLFIQHYAIGRDVVKFADNPWMWACVALGVSLLFWLVHIFRNYKFMKKVDGCAHDIWVGFKVIFTMPHKWLYFWLTIGIWGCYYLQNWVCFPGFPFTKFLMGADYCYGLLPGLVACLFVSMSMAIPSSGGLGPWNLAMMFALSLYGIGQTEAAAFAMLLWAAQALIQVLLGIFSLIYIMITDKKRKCATAKP